MLAQANSTQRMLFNSSATITSPFNYRLSVNLPAFVKHLTVTSVRQAADIIAPGYISFDIPRHGLLSKMSLTVNLLGTGTAYTTEQGAGTTQALATNYYVPPNFALSLFSAFRLYTRDKFIAELYPEDILEWVGRQTPQKQELLCSTNMLGTFPQIGATLGVGAIQGVDFTRYIELPFSFTEKLSAALLTKFAEPIELRVYLAAPTTQATRRITLSVAGSDAEAAALVTTTQNLRNSDANVYYNRALLAAQYAALVAYRAVAVVARSTVALPASVAVNFDFITPAPEEEEAMRKAMSDSVNQEGVATLQTSSMTEAKLSPTLATSPTGNLDKSADFLLRCPYPVFRTNIMIKLKDGVANAGYTGALMKGLRSTLYLQEAAAAANVYPFREVQLLASGQVVGRWNKQQLNLLNNQFQHQRKMLAGPDAGFSSHDDIISIPWNLSDVASDQTNFMSFKNLSEPTLRLVFGSRNGVDAIADAGLADYEVLIWHNYYQITQVAPADGMIRCRILN